MLSQLSHLFLITLISSWVTFIAAKQECDLSSVTPKKDFDLKKFGGKWFDFEIVSKLSADEIKLLKCNTMTYIPVSATSVNTSTLILDDISSSKWIYDNLTFAVEKDKPAIWKSTTEMFTLNFVILQTDYDSYAVVYSCLTTDTPEGLIEMYASQTKSRTPSEEIKKLATSTFASVIPKDFEKPPKNFTKTVAIQTGCPIGV